MSTTCDYPMANRPCGKTTTVRHTISAGKVSLSGDYCGEHQTYVMEVYQKLGFIVDAARVGRKRRQLYTAKSGEKFSAADVRAARGMSGAGRLSIRAIENYAEAH